MCSQTFGKCSTCYHSCGVFFFFLTHTISHYCYKPLTIMFCPIHPKNNVRQCYRLPSSKFIYTTTIVFTNYNFYIYTDSAVDGQNLRIYRLGLKGKRIGKCAKVGLKFSAMCGYYLGLLYTIAEEIMEDE